MNLKNPRFQAGMGERLLCLLFPARCLLCGDLVPPGEAFCESCRRDVPEVPCERRYSLPEAGAGGFRVLSPFAYEGGCQEALGQLKFQNYRALAKPLGRLMAETALDLDGIFDGVTWTPMTRKGKRRRGYNQSELLARTVAKALDLPCLPLLEKARETRVQHTLSREERLKNVEGAYRAKPEAAGKSLLLVDDIVTTGATQRECARALYRAGAGKVAGLCAADAQE